MATHTHLATVTREDGYWVAVVDDVPGGATEARTLTKLHVEVVDLLAGLLDVDEDELWIEYDYTQALGSAASPLARFRTAQHDLELARQDFDDAQRAAVHDLRTAGVSLRDAAQLLGISFQRVQQLDAASVTAAAAV